MVVTELQITTTRLRIIQANGVALTGSVRINCVVEVEVTLTGTAAAERLREAANVG